MQEEKYMKRQMLKYDKIKTLFFASKYIHGSLKVNDRDESIIEIKWVDINDLLNLLQEEHKPLITYLHKYINKNHINT